MQKEQREETPQVGRRAGAAICRAQAAVIQEGK
jgi:hypothetical protein